MKKLIVLVCISALILSACTKSETDGKSSPDAPVTDSASLTTDCGVVVAGKLKNPVSTSEGSLVQAQAVGSNLVIIQENGTTGQQLVKLHGVAAGNSSSRQSAINKLQSLISGGLYYFSAGADCQMTVNGQQGTIGQLVTRSGLSLSEEIVKAGLATVDRADACNGSLIGSCLKALEQTKPETAGELNAFLWKPESDSNGKLAIHTGPYNTTVVVNGETGSNQGPGNGYGSLARFSRPGCSYSNPQIQVKTSSGIPYTVGGRTTFTVGSPCSRQCVQGGNIVTCNK